MILRRQFRLCQGSIRWIAPLAQSEGRSLKINGNFFSHQSPPTRQHICAQIDSGILKHAAEANNAAVKAIFQSTVEEDYAERGTTKQHEAGTVGGLICDGGQATAMATLCRKKGN